MIGTKLYVGNLAYSTTEETLRAIFAEDGRGVSEVYIATDKMTGQARGFAFVTMASPADAEAAIAAVDGRNVDGRNIKVSEARPKAPGGGGGGGFGGGRRDDWGGGGGRDRDGRDRGRSHRGRR